MQNQKIYFITYGDNNFSIAKKHIVGLAKHSGFFEDAFTFGPKDLDQQFKKKFSDILGNVIGGGFWIWKHNIIEKVLKQIKDNDVVVYSDAGATFNFHGKKRFFEYIDLLNSSEYGNFRIECENHHKEIQFTTKELFSYFNVDIDSDIANSTQLQGGHLIFKKNKHTYDFLNEFKNVLNFDKNLITNEYNSLEQNNKFIENRHDQSIFSLLSKIYGGTSIKNETIFPKGSEDQYLYPFLSIRKGGHGFKDKAKFYINYRKRIQEPRYF